VNLRAQLEGASGSLRPTNHGAMSAALATVGVLVLAAAVTFGLGAAHVSRPAPAWFGAFVSNALLLGGLAVALRLGRPPVFASGSSFVLLSGMMLLVVGVESELVARLLPEGGPESFRSFIRHLTIERVVSAGHMLHHEAPRAIARLIEAFVGIPLP